MSTVNLILSENPDFKFVEVQFQSNEDETGFKSKTYTYKTLMPIEADQLAVVDVNGRFKVVKVTAVKDPSEVDLSVNFNYKWLVSPVALFDYEESKALEANMNKTINKLSFERKRRELTEGLQETLGKKGIEKLVNLAKSA